MLAHSHEEIAPTPLGQETKKPPALRATGNDAMQNTVSELCTFGCAVKDMNRLTPAELSWPGASYRFPLVLRNSARHSLQSHKDQCVPLHFNADVNPLQTKS